MFGVWYPLVTSVIEINASYHTNYMYICVKVKKVSREVKINSDTNS